MMRYFRYILLFIVQRCTVIREEIDSPFNGKVIFHDLLMMAPALIGSSGSH